MLLTAKQMTARIQFSDAQVPFRTKSFERSHDHSHRKDIEKRISYNCMRFKFSYALNFRKPKISDVLIFRTQTRPKIKASEIFGT